MINLLNDNKSFNQLVQYIDEDLLEVLTIEQRYTIFALAAASIVSDTRHKKTTQECDET